MTNKILLTVTVPMIDEEYDIYVPISKNIKVTIDLLVKTINELNGGYLPDGHYNLISSNGTILNQRVSVKDNNLKNGDRLTLV